MTPIKKNIISNYLGQGWSGLMAIAFLPSYVQWLGVEAFGLIGIFAVIQALVMVLDMGMSPTLNREMATITNGSHSTQSIRDLLRSLEIICYSLAMMVVIVAWLFSNYFAQEWIRADHLSSGDVARALILMTTVAALRLCEGVYRGSLYGLGYQVWYNYVFSLSSTMRYVGALMIIVWFSATIEAFFFWQAGVSLATLLILATRVHQLLPKAPLPAKFSQESIFRVWQFAGGMTAITLLTMVFLHLDKALLSRLVSLQELGYYTLAATAANVMFMVAVPATQAIYPQLVKLSFCNDQTEMFAIYRKTTKFVTILTASASMLLCFFAGGTIYMWSGSQDLIRKTAPLLSILVIGSFLNGLSYLPYQLQVAHGRTSLPLKAITLAVVLFIPSILVVVPLYGVEGAAWIWVVLNAIYLLVTSYFIHSGLLMARKWEWYLFDTLLPTCATVIVMVLAKQFQPPTYDDRLHWFIFLLFAGLLAVFVSAVLTSFAGGRSLKRLERTI
ncbi:MAG: oligosaccharide flippase family protein [Sulfuritalea sp.]|nr:oligosaccharide flippase family protein [Sulfuritalea sp.]